MLSKAVVYNLDLIAPIAMLIANTLIRLIRSNNFALLLVNLHLSPKTGDMENEHFSKTAGALLYSEHGKASPLSYISLFWKSKSVLLTVITLCATLDFIQNDDGSNASGQGFDRLNALLLSSFYISTLSSFIFDYAYYKIIYLRKATTNAKLKTITANAILTYAFFSTISIFTLYYISKYCNTYEYRSDILLLLPVYIIPAASSSYIVYVFSVLTTKVALIPAVFGVLLSSLSFAMPVWTAYLIRAIIKHNTTRHILLTLTISCNRLKKTTTSKIAAYAFAINTAFWYWQILKFATNTIYLAK